MNYNLETTVHVLTGCRKNPGKTGYSGNMGNRYMQRIVLPQSVFSLPTSVVTSADYYTNQLVCKSAARIETIVSNP